MLITVISLLRRKLQVSTKDLTGSLHRGENTHWASDFMGWPLSETSRKDFTRRTKLDDGDFWRLVYLDNDILPPGVSGIGDVAQDRENQVRRRWRKT